MSRWEPDKTTRKQLLSPVLAPFSCHCNRDFVFLRTPPALVIVHHFLCDLWHSWGIQLQQSLSQEIRIQYRYLLLPLFSTRCLEHPFPAPLALPQWIFQETSHCSASIAQDTTDRIHRRQGFHNQAPSFSPPRKPWLFSHLWSCAAAEGKALFFLLPTAPKEVTGKYKECCSNGLGIVIAN